MNATSCARAATAERLRSGCDVIVTVAAVIVKSTNSRYQITYCTYYSHVKSKSSTHTHSRRHSITASQQQHHVLLRAVHRRIPHRKKCSNITSKKQQKDRTNGRHRRIHREHSGADAQCDPKGACKKGPVPHVWGADA